MRLRLKLSPVEHQLAKAFEHFQIVNAHEHVPSERIRLEMNVDVFSLFNHYTRRDLITVGMPPDTCETIHNIDRIVCLWDGR